MYCLVITVLLPFASCIIACSENRKTLKFMLDIDRGKSTRLIEGLAILEFDADRCCRSYILR